MDVEGREWVEWNWCWVAVDLELGCSGEFGLQVCVSWIMGVEGSELSG